MKKQFKGLLRPLCPLRLTHYLTAFLFLGFSWIPTKVQSQWTTPDGSGNIYNTNSGDVIVKSPTSNAGWLLYVNPLGQGGISVGETNTASGGYTSLTMGISAYQGGYCKIQSIQSAGSAWGLLALNPGGGNVVIGKTTQTNTSYVLDINGPARANQLVVNTTGADYVFDPGYRLSSLGNLDTYIHKEHHLPGIASAEQMKQEGLNLGDNQTLLLAKIEELTLYIIEQDKRSSTLEEKLKQLEDRNQALADRNKALEDQNRRLQDYDRILQNLQQRISQMEQANDHRATK